MSSHLRSGIAGFFLVAGFSTPAFSNALTDLFTPNAAPAPSTEAAAPAKDECLPQPGRSTAAGQHWVYRYDGQRKCWFQAAEETALARKPVRRRLERRSVAASEEDTPAPHRQNDVEDARAQMPSPAPEQTPQSAPLEPKLTIVHTVPVRAADAAGQVPPAPDPTARPGVDQPTPDQPRQLDVETLLAKAPAAGEEVASATPAMPVAALTAKTGGGQGWMTSWLGVLLVALGSAALLSSSPTLRRAIWPVRFRDAATEFPVFAHDGWDEPSFDWSASVSPASGEPRFPAATRPPLAAEPSREPSWDEAIGAIAALTTPVPPEAFLKKRRNGLARG